MAILTEKGNMNGNRSVVFLDTSALKAVFDKDDEFHQKAISFWDKAKSEKIGFVTSNFILDEFYTLARSHLGKSAALQFHQDLVESAPQLKITRIVIKDEVKAWKYFEKLPDRRLSFTDCTSFAVMERAGLKEVFAFDKHFARAGFKVLP